jgi:hypothetical protein
VKGDGLPPDRVVPTVGLNIGRVEDENAKLVFWDLGGQVRLLVPLYGLSFLSKPLLWFILECCQSNQVSIMNIHF